MEAAEQLQRIPEHQLTAAGMKVKKYIVDFNLKDTLNYGDYDSTELKKDMFMIYEGTLADPIKTKNNAVAKKAIAELRPAAINVFDQERT